MYVSLHVQCPLFWSDFNEIWIFLKNLRKILKYKISRKSFPCEPRCFMLTRQTDRHDEAIIRFSNFSEAPENLICGHMSHSPPQHLHQAHPTLNPEAQTLPLDHNAYWTNTMYHKIKHTIALRPMLIVNYIKCSPCQRVVSDIHASTAETGVVINMFHQRGTCRVSLQGSAEHCSTDSSTWRHVALFTNCFSSFTLARRKKLVLSGHDDALWLWSAAGHLNSILPPEWRQRAGAAGQSTAKCRCLVCTWRLTARFTDQLQIRCGWNLWP
jgi:hypothetical protein